MKTTPKILSLLIIGLVLVLACKGLLRKECRKDFATEQGIILRRISDGCYPALNFPDNPEKHWVVTRKTQWDSIWTDYDKKYTTSCDTPIVDFNTESVLAIFHGSGHGIKNIRSVSKNDAGKNIHYKILDVDCNKDKVRTMEWLVSYNLVVVPKIPADYTVSFEILEGN